MINQFGVKGFNLVNGAFEFYEVYLLPKGNNPVPEYKGTVRKGKLTGRWCWQTDNQGSFDFDCEHSAIVALKKHLTEGDKHDQSSF